MAQTLTELALLKSQEQSKSIQIIYEIEGVDDFFGSDTIESIIKIGDEDLYIDGTWVIGGIRAIADQNSDPLISAEGTSDTIEQQLEPDRAVGTSVSVFDISLIDQNNTITELITPGNTLTDILGVRTKVYYGFADTSFPRDYIVAFRGIITAVKSVPGLITISNSHPEEIKRQTIFQKRQTNLDGAISDTNTGTFNVDSTSGFLAPVNGPDGTIDDDLKFYIKIDDEIMRYESLTSTSFTVTERGALSTTATTHDDNTQVESFFVLEGNAMELALKLMLSGWEGPCEEDVSVTNFVQIGDGTEVANTIFFIDININKKYGITAGDYITTTGATNGANNVSTKEILQIVNEDNGSYIVIDDVSFVLEVNTDAVIDFRSKYDVFPEGAGLKMYIDHVDVLQHEKIRDRFLSSLNYRFFIKEDIEGKEFIDEEFYNPAGCYMVPRAGRSGVQFHSPPFPGEEPKTLNKTNIYNFDQLEINRTSNRNFYNTIIYRYQNTALEDEFTINKIVVSGDSLTRLSTFGAKSLKIESLGLKSDLNADSSVTLIGARRLRRYEFAAEYIPQTKVFLEQGIGLDVGDIVLFDGEDLQITNINAGNRDFTPRLLEITNKTFSLSNGEIGLALTDTAFDEQARYCLMSPSSKVKTGISTTQFVIGESFSGKYDENEFQKWTSRIGAGLRIRSEDGSTSDTCTLSSVSGNVITVSALSFTPSAGYIMELSEYNNQPNSITLLYGFMTDEATFDDDESHYSML